MDRVRKLLNIDLIHKKGYTGKNIGVAVLDTGIAPHLDLKDNVAAFKDFVNNRTGMYDDNGHGTHVSGIIAGKGIKSNGMYRGIAPDAKIIMLKCLDYAGNGSIKDASKAINYIIESQSRYNIRVVNISIGSVLKDSRDNEFLIDSVEMLWNKGFVVIVAAGNNGPEYGSITVPGCAKSVITVGANDDNLSQNNIVRNMRRRKGFLNYSGRGPTQNCIIKPEIVCPGTNIISCSSVGRAYSVKSGTSMSAPIVAGVVALMLEKNPNYTNKTIKREMFETSIDLGYDKNHQGWGLINPSGLIL